MKVICKKTLRNIVTGHLNININSIRNKFDLLVRQIKGNFEVLVISQTKIERSFPIGQFKIHGYASPFFPDRDQQEGGIMVFIRENTPF